MSYFGDLDIMRGAPCLLDEIAALRGEETETTMRGYDQWATQSDEHLLADDEEEADVRYHAYQYGGSWIVEDMVEGSIVAVRPDAETARQVVDRLTALDLDDEKAQERRWRVE